MNPRRAEVMLIHASQHIFKDWLANERNNKELEQAFECVWERIQEIRLAEHHPDAKPRLKPLARVLEAT